MLDILKIRVVSTARFIGLFFRRPTASWARFQSTGTLSRAMTKCLKTRQMTGI
jgi:hypothetical protein